MPDELLTPEIFDMLLEAKVLIERWRRHYNTARPHRSLGYRPPGTGGDCAMAARLRGCAPPLAGHV